MAAEPVGPAGARLYRAPTSCPVCSHELITLRVGCPDCGTELSGHFATCRFCQLDPADLALLEVFLRSRGNIRDAQAHLGVSYPTARQRVGELLGRLGYSEGPEEQAGVELRMPPTAPTAPTAQSDQEQAESPVDRRLAAAILADLAAGRINVDQAADSLGAMGWSA